MVATRDRCDELMTTLGHLSRLPERPGVVVVDNGSRDGTVEAVRSKFGHVRIFAAGSNLGAAARNVGAEMVATPYVAFADDDSWWAPGALARAVDHLDASPRLALLQARIMVGNGLRLDPVCAEMARSPLPHRPDLPGPSLLGFVACGAVVRRKSFLGAGGFDDLLEFGGEEQLLAQDLAAAGCGLAYVDDVVALHHPSPVRDHAHRQERQLRNALLATWMRRPLGICLRRTAAVAARSPYSPSARRSLSQAARRLPTALHRRRLLPAHVEAQVALLET